MASDPAAIDVSCQRQHWPIKDFPKKTKINAIRLRLILLHTVHAPPERGLSLFRRNRSIP
jgi:hypothetical protein